MSRPTVYPQFALLDQNDPTSGKPNTAEPNQAFKDYGWLRRDKPWRQHYNYLFRTIDQWIEWFDSLYDESITDSAVIFNQSLKTTDSPSFSGLNVDGSVDIAYGGLTLTLGADSNASTRTDSTNKLARIACYHYTNAEEPTAMIAGYSYGSNSYLYLGGGSSSMNAVTDIKFYTASDNITTTGTERMSINSSGVLTVNYSAEIQDGLYVHTDSNEILFYDTLRFDTSNNYIIDWYYGSSLAGLYVNNDLSVLTIKKDESTWFEIDITDGNAKFYNNLKVDGNVGINTTSTILSTLVVQNDNAGGLGGEITILNGSSVTVGSYCNLNFGLDSSTYNDSNASAQIKAIVTTGGGASDIAFSSWTGALFTEKMRIKSDLGIGILTSSPAGALDVAYGGYTLSLGADFNLATRTNSTDKYFKIGCYHYTNSQEPMGILYGISGSTTNYLYIGGGHSSLNAATDIKFYTAANSTTTTGTERMSIDSSGNVGIATSSALGKLDISYGGLTLVLGANSGTTTRTNNTAKISRISSYHYTNTEEPVAMMLCDNTVSANSLEIGGGSSSMNAATSIKFYTAANSTTTIGTERMSINSIGNVAINGLTTILTSDLTSAALTVQGTQLMRFKYGPTGYDVSGAPIILRYTDTKSLTHGFAHSSFLITFNARGLYEMWNLSVEPTYNGTWNYKAQRISGSTLVRCFECVKTTTDLTLEFIMSDSDTPDTYNDSIEITVMEVAAGHNGTHYGTFATYGIASKTGGTELNRGGNSQAAFGGTSDHWIMGKLGISTLSPGGRLDISYSGASSIPTILIGADSGSGNIARTDYNTKDALIGSKHYTNSEEPVCTIYTTNESSVNSVSIGGGHSYLNAATIIKFFTASTTDVTTGTERMQIRGDGSVVVGSASGGGQGAGTINAVAVYDDGALLTGYVLDYFIDKKINLEKYVNEKRAVNRFLDYSNICLNIDKYNEYVFNNHCLPSMYDIEKNNKKPSVGDLAQRLWEIVEIQTEHIRQLNEEIKKIKNICCK